MKKIILFGAIIFASFSNVNAKVISYAGVLTHCGAGSVPNSFACTCAMISQAACMTVTVPDNPTYGPGYRCTIYNPDGTVRETFEIKGHTASTNGSNTTVTLLLP